MKRRRRTAFTLLELLVALTMSATIAGSLAASLYIAYHARNSAEAAIDAAHANDSVGDIISRDLLNAVPPTPNTNNDLVLSGTFVGDTASVQFYASGGESRSTLDTDLKQVEFLLDADPDNPNSTVLIRRVTTNLLAAITPEPIDEVICRNVQSFTLSYFDGTTWYETWDSTEHNDALPYGVELTIVQVSPDNSEELRQIDRRITLPCGVYATEDSSSSNSSSSSSTGGGL